LKKKNNCFFCTILVTGHSSGAAVGTIASIDLQHNATLSYDDIIMYNFGSPRVGNEAFS
jgi:predicted lipase